MAHKTKKTQYVVENNNHTAVKNNLIKHGRTEVKQSIIIKLNNIDTMKSCLHLYQNTLLNKNSHVTENNIHVNNR
jgi:hypothetical protein